MSGGEIFVSGSVAASRALPWAASGFCQRYSSGGPSSISMVKATHLAGRIRAITSSDLITFSRCSWAYKEQFFHIIDIIDRISCRCFSPVSCRIYQIKQTTYSREKYAFQHQHQRQQ